MVKYAERAPGVYRSKFIALDTDFKIEDRETGEVLTRWRWVFEDMNPNPAIGDTIDAITSAGFKARSNGLKFFTGMLGRAPTTQDDTDSLIGKIFDVVFGPNQNGRNTITGVLRPGASGDDLEPALSAPRATIGEALP